MSSKRRTWFRQRLPASCLLRPDGTINVTLFVSCLLRERRSIELQEDGLDLVGWFGRRRHLPWAGLGQLRHYGEWAAFSAGRERIVLDARTVDWRRLFREIERHVSPDAEPADGMDAVAAEEVARCLGIGVDGVLLCRPRFNADELIFFLILAAGPAILALGQSLWAIAALACLGLGLWRAGRERSQREVRAEVSGLVARRGREEMRVAWSAVRRVDRRAAPMGRCYLTRSRFEADREVLVTTEDGVISFLLSDAGARQLEDGIGRLLEARAAGHALPSGAPLSDAAISQVRLRGEADAGRGLSRAAEDAAR